MKMFLLSLSVCAIALATPVAAEPLSGIVAEAPPVSAPVEERQNWCQAYVTWLFPTSREAPPPADQRATHQFEVEFSSCVLNPHDYQQQTQPEAIQRAAE